MMGIPNNNGEELNVEQTRALIESIKKPIRWIAARTGISERRLRYLLAGGRLADGAWLETVPSYPERFCLECLAYAVEVMEMP